MLPLVAFGTPDQQQRYLPRLASGETVGAYCLSESGSGSDALGARTRATRLDDGSFSISGEKMWITNAGFADVFIVFAKVDGEAFTAFIVERAFPGVSIGEEEHKMGLHASSTAPVILQDARVPAGNVLGEIGRGHKVAFNVLNYGRLKLGAATAGGARAAIAEAAAYAAERRQFGQPIASFGAIRAKLATMAVRIYVLESLLLRTTGLIDRAIDAGEGSPAARLLAALEEYAIEASIAKVAGSETADYVVDENVQIHGGNGFVSDYPAERRYRDARVNRIFEGTNEINRLLIAGLLARRAAKGDIGLIAAAKRLADECDRTARRRRRRRRPAGRGPPHGGGPEEGGAARARHRDAALRREARRRAGGADVRRRSRDRRVRRRERAAAGRAGATRRRALRRRPRGDRLHRDRRRRAARRDDRARSASPR